MDTTTKLQTKLQDYECEQCGSRLTNKYNLKRHKIEVHGGLLYRSTSRHKDNFDFVTTVEILNFNSDETVCQQCNASFRDSHSLRRHILTVHEDIQVVSRKRFILLKEQLGDVTIGNTLMIQDGKVIGSVQKDLSMKYGSTCKREARTSCKLEYICDLCKTGCETFEELTIHINSHIQDSDQSEKEDKNEQESRLNIEKKHGKHQTYVCSMCTMAFRDKNNLIQHRLIEHNRPTLKSRLIKNKRKKPKSKEKVISCSSSKDQGDHVLSQQTVIECVPKKGSSNEYVMNAEHVLSHPEVNPCLKKEDTYEYSMNAEHLISQTAVNACFTKKDNYHECGMNVEQSQSALNICIKNEDISNEYDMVANMSGNSPHIGRLKRKSQRSMPLDKETRNYECDVCGVCLSCDYNLRRHKSEVHKGLSYRSLVKNKRHAHLVSTMESVTTLTYEITIQNCDGSNRTMCNKCGSSFRDMRDLKRHTLEVHDGIKLISKKSFRCLKQQLKGNVKGNILVIENGKAVGHVTKGSRSKFSCGKCCFKTETSHQMIQHFTDVHNKIDKGSHDLKHRYSKQRKEDKNTDLDNHTKLHAVKIDGQNDGLSETCNQRDAPVSVHCKKERDTNEHHSLEKTCFTVSEDGVNLKQQSKKARAQPMNEQSNESMYQPLDELKGQSAHFLSHKDDLKCAFVNEVEKERSDISNGVSSEYNYNNNDNCNENGSIKNSYFDNCGCIKNDNSVENDFKRSEDHNSVKESKISENTKVKQEVNETRLLTQKECKKPIHKMKGTIRCNQCGIMVASTFSLEQHRNLVHKSKLQNVEKKCDKTILKTEKLQQVVQESQDNIRQITENKNKTVATEKALLHRIKEEATKSEVHQQCNCEYCGNSYLGRAHFHRHLLQVHQGIQNIKIDKHKQRVMGRMVMKNSSNLMSQISTPKPRFNCGKCNISFNSKRILRRHLSAIHRHQQKDCMSESKKFSHMDKRTKISQRSTHLTCNKCGIKLEKIYSIKKHHTEAHVKQPSKLAWYRSKVNSARKYRKSSCFSCSVCSTKFRSLNQWHTHFHLKICRVGKKTSEKNNFVHGQIVPQRRREKKDMKNLKESGIPSKYGAKLNQCIHCRKSMSSQNHLKRHESLHVGKVGIRCFACKKQFLCRKYLIEHMKSHIPERNVECKMCHKIFKSLKYYLRHVNISKHACKPPEGYLCEICSKSFTTMGNLTVHKRSHSNTRSHFICSTCGKTFIYQSSLSKHRLVHSDNRPFKCIYCSSSFKVKYVLNQHVKMKHTKEEHIHVCDQCPKSFVSANLLKRHQYRVHVIHEKSHSCDYCGKCFTESTYLKKHLLIHMDVKPHKCEICGKCFQWKQHLKAHIRMHKGIKLWGCEKCGIRYTDKRSYNHHIQRCTVLWE